MEKVYILMDVGGTQIKGSVADRNGLILGEPICARAHSGREDRLYLTILQHLYKGFWQV